MQVKMAEAQAEIEEEDFDLIRSLDDTGAEKDDKTSPVIRQLTMLSLSMQFSRGFLPAR
jgi:hypothetical protein